MSDTAHGKAPPPSGVRLWFWPAFGAALVVVAFALDQRLALVLFTWFAAWGFNAWIAGVVPSPAVRFLVPAVFGVTLIGLWEMTVVLFDVPSVILPAPTAIAERFGASLDILWIDFRQTILKGALTGLAIGSCAAVLVALAVDRSPFLQRGVLPAGNFLAALPIVGTAPIMVMWFGFGWSSKAAVVVLMVFFPMLVNTVQGLKATDRIARDLMHTYAASYGQALWKLRLPAALPFIFNGLKVASTLALIGAIVAEFFGSPVEGMGFRIKTSFGSFDLDLVWAEVAVAALAGSALYGLISLAERALTFWHPSQRGGR